VKFQDRVAWVNLLFVPEAGINLLRRDLMSDISCGGKKIKISLNLMTAQIEDQILQSLDQGFEQGRATIHIDP
jgi:hypothetical protein